MKLEICPECGGEFDLQQDRKYCEYCGCQLSLEKKDQPQPPIVSSGEIKPLVDQPQSPIITPIIAPIITENSRKKHEKKPRPSKEKKKPHEKKESIKKTPLKTPLIEKTQATFGEPDDSAESEKIWLDIGKEFSDKKRFEKQLDDLFDI